MLSLFFSFSLFSPARRAARRVSREQAEAAVSRLGALSSPGTAKAPRALETPPCVPAGAAPVGDESPYDLSGTMPGPGRACDEDSRSQHRTEGRVEQETMPPGEPSADEPSADEPSADEPSADEPSGGDRGTDESAYPPAAGRLGERLTGKLPLALRGGQLDPGRRAVGALAAVGLVAALVAGVCLWRAQPDPVAVPPRQRAASPSLRPLGATARPASAGAVASAPAGRPAAAPPTRSASASTPAEVVVDVGGKVEDPGVYTLPAGSRVTDAVDAAGGITDDADITGINLARRLVDGEKILVGVPRPPSLAAAPSAPGSSFAGSSAGAKVDINAASEEELEELPGIGPVLAGRIVGYRTEHGGFGSTGQLKDVSGIGDKTFADLEDKVTA